MEKTMLRARSMKKDFQIAENRKIENAVNKAMEYLNKNYNQVNHSRLRNCSAEVLSTPEYRYLRSYRTIVAIIDNDGNCYDFLRKVYGYTSTSAQHISKFSQDFSGRFRQTWREV